MEGIGCTGKYSDPVIALTYRDHGHNVTELFSVNSGRFLSSVLEEGAVVELQFNPNNIHNMIIGAKIIDFDADGTSWQYRS